MKKWLTMVMVVAIGAGALYVVYEFRTNRLTSDRLNDISNATERVEKAEAATARNAGSEATGINADTDIALAADTPADGSSAESSSNGETLKVVFECSNGTFGVECHRKWAPNGFKRFRELVEAGYFTDMRIFRVVPGFVAQFGISGDPATSQKWVMSNIPDDKPQQSNKRGTLTFAAAGRPNTRSAQLFINYSDNARLDGMGFAPIGEVTFGMDVVDGFNSQYGEDITRLQESIIKKGNAFLDDNFPGLDSIVSAKIVDEFPAAGSGDEPADPQTETNQPAGSSTDAKE